MRTKLLFLIAAVLAGCSQPPTAQEIVDRAIEAHGGEILENAEVTFAFRGRSFRVVKNNGMFSYERTYVDTTGARIHEVLSNDGLYREVDGERVELDQKSYNSAETAVNSVVYFALLPAPLNDPAARKTNLGTTQIRGQTYHEIEVTFAPEGGGRDYDDRFIYWFSDETGTMDYLSYFFHVNDTGSRFREAFNVRTIAGVRFADYHNSQSDELGIDQIQAYDSLFAIGSLPLVSDIVLDDVRVRPLID